MICTTRGCTSPGLVVGFVKPHPISREYGYCFECCEKWQAMGYDVRTIRPLGV